MKSSQSRRKVKPARKANRRTAAIAGRDYKTPLTKHSVLIRLLIQKSNDNISRGGFPPLFLIAFPGGRPVLTAGILRELVLRYKETAY